MARAYIAMVVVVLMLHVLLIGPVPGHIRSTVPYPGKAARMARFFYFPMFLTAYLSPTMLRTVEWYVSLFTLRQTS